MNDVTAKPIEALVIRRRFAASRERVFAAWTQPELLQQWIGPLDIIVTDVQVDARVGGAYRIAMRMPDGREWIVAGDFREIAPPERLVFTWIGKSAANAGLDTVIALDFCEVDGSTDVVLTHSNFAVQQVRDGHSNGWESGFKKLDAIL